MNVTVLGAGSWGTALTILLARNGHDVTLFGRPSEDLEVMRATRENMRYLPGFLLPKDVQLISWDEEAPETDMWVVAVPSPAVRGVLPRIHGENPLVVLASKGLEPMGPQMLHQLCAEMIPGGRIGALSGPNLAVEIVRGILTAAIAAFADAKDSEIVRYAFLCRTFRVYVSEDVTGVELAGALKNVLAIGAGISDGLGFGDNTKGALLARGLREMILIGQAMEAKFETFLGIAGVGDLFATAVSKLSRNYRVGRSIGEGLSLRQALDSIGQVAEGVATSEAAMRLSRQHQVPMPVFETIEAVLHGRVRPLDGVSMLMERMTLTEGGLDASCLKS